MYLCVGSSSCSPFVFMCVGVKTEKPVGSLLRETLFVWIYLQWKQEIFSEKNLISTLHLFYYPAYSVNFSFLFMTVFFISIFITFKAACSTTSLSLFLILGVVFSSLHLPFFLRSLERHIFKMNQCVQGSQFQPLYKDVQFQEEKE